MNRVAVTGVGAISACGDTALDLWTAARGGRSAVGPVAFPRLARQSVRHAAKISAEKVERLLTDHKPRFQDPVAVLALVAAEEAVAQAGLSLTHFGARSGVVVGSGFGGAATVDRNYFRLAEHDYASLDPMSVPKTMANSAAAWIGMAWGITGPTYCISTACSSSTQSIGLATQLVRAGIVDRCVAGGSEALLVDGIFAGWERLHVMSPTACRPFSVGRNGMVLGEGAGIVVLENLELARARGAEVLAEVRGYGTTTDASDLLRPDLRGAQSCMRMALDDARIDPAEIGYVNAHGTGTVANDVVETQALREVFGGDFDSLKVSSTKPVHGHALGASGALEFIITICALNEQVAPPTLNFAGIDPKIGFRPVADGAEAFQARAAMTNSFAFGGVNASLIVARDESFAC